AISAPSRRAARAMPKAIERLERSPVTRMRLPESRAIERLYFRPHETPPALVHRPPDLRNGRGFRAGRPEDPARHVAGGGNRLRPGASARLLLRNGHRGDLRHAARLRLHGPAREAGAACR